MKWEYVKAEEFCDSVRDGTHDTPKQTASGFKLVTGKHIKDGQIDPTSAYYISKKDYDSINIRSKVEQWDVIMSMIGTVGEAAVVKNMPDYAIKNVALFKCGGSELKGKWLSYYLRSPDGRGQMNGGQKGSSQQFLSLKQLRNLMVPVTDERKMRQVVSVLSSFDNLIENNQRQIKLLEEAAQRLYQEWFVKLRFPGHEKVKVVDGVPEGWKSCALGDVIDFNPKISVKKGQKKVSVPMSALSTTLMVIDSTQFTHTMSNAGSKFQNGDTLLARITPCLQNGKTGFVWGLDPEEVAVGSTEFIVMRSKSLNPYMVYLLARTDDFREYAIKSMTGSDGRQRAQTSKIELFPYCLPSVETVNQFCDFVAPIFQTIFSLNCQCERLAEARDRLLPKLMSGEIEV